MKKLIAMSFLVLFLMPLQTGFAQQATPPMPKPGQESTPALPNIKDSSYAFGVLIATSLKSSFVTIDYDSFVNALKDVLDRNTPKMTTEEANRIVQTVVADAREKMAAANLAKEAKFLAENGKKTGVVTTESGLQYQVIQEGAGTKPLVTDTVKVNYVGTFLDGTKFDSSYDRKQPAIFRLNQVIPGWSEGIQHMTVGSKYRFFIPSKLAYGETGAGGGRIAPNSTLIFEVELLEIEGTNPPTASPRQ